jgi:hypothetical protein
MKWCDFRKFQKESSNLKFPWRTNTKYKFKLRIQKRNMKWLFVLQSSHVAQFQELIPFYAKPSHENQSSVVVPSARP